MRQASEGLKQAMEAGSARFYQKAHIVFSNGSELDLGRNDFYISGNGFSDGAGTNALALGEAMAKSVNMILVNDEDQMSEYDFYNAEITVWCCIDLPETESLKIGTFTIGTPTAKEGEIEITGTDDMHKGDVDYDTALSFPVTAKQMLLDSCQKCGVSLKSENFTNDGFVILTKPTQCTHRSVWGMIAMLAGGNARMDEENRLEIISYDLSFFARQGLDGGKFDSGEPLYETGDAADGGNFIDYSSGDAYDGGGFEELGRYHMFYNSQTPTIDTDDVVITGVQASSGDSAGLYGAEGYILTVENQLIAGKVQEGVNAIGRLITGMRFRPFTVDHTAYPLAEFGDICYVFDRKGNYYQSVVTDINFSFYGYTTIKCSADSVMRNRAEYKPAAAGIVADVEKQTEERFEEVNQGFEDINQGIDEINQEIGEVNENIGGLQISLQKTSDGLNAEVKRALSAEESIGSRISLTESNIDIEVRRAKGAEESLSSRINIAEGNINIEVERAKGAEQSLGSRISLTESSIDLKVNKGDVVTQINLSPDTMHLSSGRLTITSGNFLLDGYGNITANGGKIAGFTISGDNLMGSAVTLSPLSVTAATVNCQFLNGNNGMSITGGGGQITVGHNASLIYLQTESEFHDTVRIYNALYYPFGTQEPTISGSANVGITGTGYMKRVSSSSKRWKHDISEIESGENDPHRLYETRTREFVYNDGYLEAGDSRTGKKIPGFVVEELIEDYPIAVDCDKNGRPQSWSEKMFIAPILFLLKEQHRDIEKIKEKLCLQDFQKQ